MDMEHTVEINDAKSEKDHSADIIDSCNACGVDSCKCFISSFLKNTQIFNEYKFI